jgi:hypothetical protein
VFVHAGGGRNSNDQGVGMNRWILFCPLLAIATGCPDQPLALTTSPIAGLPEAGNPPLVSLSAPDSVLGPVDIIGDAYDPDQPAMTLLAALTSSKDGELYVGNPTPDGLVAWTGELTPGDHELVLAVEDAAGNRVETSRSLMVIGDNIPPNCDITSPTDGALLPSGEYILFSADVDDPDGEDATTLWWSDRHGAMVLGESFEFILADGVHLIRVDVMDERGGTCQDTITVTIGD